MSFGVFNEALIIGLTSFSYLDLPWKPVLGFFLLTRFCVEEVEVRIGWARCDQLVSSYVCTTTRKSSFELNFNDVVGSSLLFCCQVFGGAALGRFVIPIISLHHQDRGLELSGSCQSNKSEFFLNQYPQSAPSQLHSHVWNDASRAVSQIAALDPTWWTDFVNTELFLSEVHQGRQIVPASVYKTSHAIEAQSKISAAFQTAFQPYGFSQQSVEFSTPANFATDFGPQVFQAYPEIAKSTTSQNSMPLVQPDWKSSESSLTSEFDYEISSMTSRVLTPLENETTSHESQENTKSQISVLHASRCQHCSQIFSIERLGYVL